MLVNASRELTPADLRVLEPDLFGAVALVLHGRGPEERRIPPEPQPERDRRPARPPRS